MSIEHLYPPENRSVFEAFLTLILVTQPSSQRKWKCCTMNSFGWNNHQNFITPCLRRHQKTLSASSNSLPSLKKLSDASRDMVLMKIWWKFLRRFWYANFSHFHMMVGRNTSIEFHPTTWKWQCNEKRSKFSLVHARNVLIHHPPTHNISFFWKEVNFIFYNHEKEFFVLSTDDAWIICINELDKEIL